VVITFNKKTKLYKIIYFSTIYFIKSPLLVKKPTIFFDFNTKQLFVLSHYINNYNILFNKIINIFINSNVKPIFNKLKFKGKGYYLYKNYRNTITPQFGYSHRLYLYSFFCKVKFLSKTSLICFGLSTKTVKNVS
jgi:hypothetical protein